MTYSKEQIEEALNYIAQCFPGVEMVNKDDAFSSFSPNELAEFITQYLETKREEIERKSWIAGFIEKASSFYISNMEDEEVANIFYDQWKESQNQEHGI